MNDRDLIVALGDSAVLAERLGVTQPAVSNWKARGIPWQVRPDIKELARRKRIKLPSDFLTTKRLP